MKPKTTISVLLYMVGFLISLGSVGAADCNTISLNQLVVQGGIGIAMMIGGGILGV